MIQIYHCIQKRVKQNPFAKTSSVLSKNILNKTDGRTGLVSSRHLWLGSRRRACHDCLLGRGTDRRATRHCSIQLGDRGSDPLCLFLRSSDETSNAFGVGITEGIIGEDEEERVAELLGSSEFVPHSLFEGDDEVVAAAQGSEDDQICPVHVSPPFFCAPLSAYGGLRKLT